MRATGEPSDLFGGFSLTDDQILRAMRAVVRENSVTAEWLLTCVRGMFSPSRERFHTILWDAIDSGDLVLDDDRRLALPDLAASVSPKETDQ